MVIFGATRVWLDGNVDLADPDGDLTWFISAN